MNKVVIDVAAMICLLITFVSGVKLHTDIHHTFVGHQGLMYRLHVITGILTAISIFLHCYQHKYWFANYRRIPFQKKRITTVLLAVVILVIITGFIFASGCNTSETSMWHYLTGIILFFMAMGHVIKRWNMFRKLSLLKR